MWPLEMAYSSKLSAGQPIFRESSRAASAPWSWALGEKLLLVMDRLQAKIGCNGGTSRVRIHAARKVNVKTIFTLSETQGRTLRGVHEYCSVVVGIHGEATTRGDNIGDS
jgi:hypothetical protein